MNHPTLLQIQAAIDSGDTLEAAIMCRKLADDLKEMAVSARDVLKVIESVPGSNRATIISLSGWGKTAVDLAIKMLVGKGLVTSKAQPVPRSDGRNRTVPTYYAQGSGQ